MFDLLFGGRHVTFESPLRMEEATLRLQRDIANPEWRPFENRPQSFFGTFADGRFHMQRLIRGRNAFRPVIDGRLSPAVNGCRVDARLKLPATGVFACVLLLAIGVTMLWFAIPHAIGLVTRDPTFVVTDFTVVLLWLLLIAPGMVVMPAVHTIIEARRATRLLARVFSSSPDNFSRSTHIP